MDGLADPGISSHTATPVTHIFRSMLQISIASSVGCPEGSMCVNKPVPINDEAVDVQEVADDLTPLKGQQVSQGGRTKPT